MNKRERFLAFAGFEKVDRVPRHAGYVPALKQKMTEHLGKDPNEFFEMDIPGGAYLRPPDSFKFPDYSVCFPLKNLVSCAPDIIIGKHVEFCLHNHNWVNISNHGSYYQT